MAHIKCRYTIPYCTYGGRLEPQVHNEFWFCDGMDDCDIAKYTKPEDAVAVNPICVHCEFWSGEFEKDLKQYEYDGDLKVGRKLYRGWDIDYLETDGRILKDE